MNEMLMLGQAKAKAGLDIDFEDAEIGSTTIVDKNGHPFTLVGTIATVPSSPGLPWVQARSVMEASCRLAGRTHTVPLGRDA